MTLRLAASTALLLVLSSGSALSAVTPEEVWESWQAFSSAAGQDLTVGSVARVGDALVVTGLVVTYADDLGGSFSAEIDRLTFTDNGDGTVAVTMSETYPVTLAFAADTEGPSTVALTVFQPGLVITAGGSATETAFDFEAPTVMVVLDEARDQAGAAIDTRASLTMTGSTASYLVVGTGSDTTRLQSRFKTAALSLDISGDGPEGPGGVTLSLADLAGETEGTFPGADLMSDLAAALDSGFTIESQFVFGPVTLAAESTEAAGQTSLTGQAAGSDFVLAIDKTQMNYGVGLRGASVTVAGPDIPFPQVGAAFGELAFNLLMPVSRSDTPQDFAFLTKFADVTLSEDIWGLFDAEAILPRDPATVILDVRGTGRWLVDIMDPAGQASGTEPPGELTSLDLAQILVRAAGAEVGAKGALTFDNSDLTSFEGIPAPAGSITVDIKGVNALIDNLIAIGLLPDDQAMGARMMLGLFTRPGAGPDQVTSLIEFRDGGLFANGQQLQ
jgi:hypothetical protein